MAQTIKLKRSAVAGRIPSTSDLDLGEMAINTVDGKLYIKKNIAGEESIVEIGSLDDVDSINFSAVAEQGELSWDEDKSTLVLSMGNGVVQQIGEELYYPKNTKNSTAAVIPNGTPVMLVGGVGEDSYIAPAIADGSIPHEYYAGLTTEEIGVGEYGRVLFFGSVNDVNTSSFNKGDILYVSDVTPGGFTTDKPESPSHAIQAALVTKVGTTDGRLFVRVHTNPEASEITYDNTTSGLVASNVKGALDELQQNKASVDLLSSNIVLFPTTASSDVTNHNRLVISKSDTDYNTTAVDIATGSIGSTETLVGQLISDAGLVEGSIAGITVTLLGNIEKTAGNSNQGAHFYFKMVRREADGTEHEMGESFHTSTIFETDGYEQFSSSVYLSDSGISTFSLTDRIVLRFYGIAESGSPEYNFQFGGSSPIRSIVPVPISVIPSTAADQTPVDTSSFNGILDNTATNVQAALDTIDDHDHATEYAPLTGANYNNWDTAYGWGNHALVGYITGYSETDTLQTVTDRGAVTTNQLEINTAGTQQLVLGTTNSSFDGAGNIEFRKQDDTLTGRVSMSYSSTMKFLELYTNFLTEASEVRKLRLYTGGDLKLTKGSAEYKIWDASDFSSTKVSNWDTAYGWGDHSQVGYLTTYEETDPVFSASDAANITATGISNWNTAYGWGDHSSVGYLTSETNDYLDSATFSGGTLTLGRTGSLSDVTVSLDGRYSQTDTNTTYSVSAADVASGKAIRLTGSDAVTDDVILAGGNNVSLTRSGDTITINSADAAAETITTLTKVGNDLRYVNEAGTTATIDLTSYLDDTNLSKILSGTVNSSGIATFSRDDSSTFTVDMSVLLDDTNLARIVSAGWNTGNGVLTLTRNDGSTIPVDLDNRYLQSYAETDTLASVTARGNSTSSNITISKSNTGAGYSSYADMMIEDVDAHLDITSTNGGTWGSAINLREGSTSSFVNSWSIARTTGASPDLRFNFGTGNDHNVAGTKVRFTSSGQVHASSFHGSIDYSNITNPPPIDNSVDYINAASFNTGNGVLTLSGVGRAGATVDLDGRYYNTSDSDSRYVNVTGDTMTGVLTFNRSATRQVINLNGTAGAHSLGWEAYHNTYGPHTWDSGFIGHKFYSNANTLTATIGTGGASGSTVSTFYGRTDFPAGLTSQTLDIGYTGDRTIQALSTDKSFGTYGDLHLQHYGGDLHAVHGGGVIYDNGSRVFSDRYHPNADKWTTPKTNTVTLTGDVTGSGSASVDGSGNWTVAMTTDLNVASTDTFTGTYPIAWLATDNLYKSTWLTINGANDTLNTRNISADGTVTATSFSGNLNYNDITNPPVIDNSVDYINGASFNTSNGVLTLSGVGRAGATIDLDGRYSTSDTTYSTNTAYGTSMSGTQIRINGGEIPGSVDLNTYRTQGVYAQNANSDATSGSNYPENAAGILTVDDDMYGNGIHTAQTYYIYSNQNVYTRSYYNGSWTAWRNLAQDTVYTHPSYNGDDINLDTGPLTGATVISDLDFNVTTDTLGHVTDANATYSTRTLTAADIGAQPAGSYVLRAGDTMTGQLTVPDVKINSGSVAVTSDDSCLTINGNYTNGTYSHRLRKQDLGGGVPLFIDSTSGTANAHTALARFGTYSGNSYTFDVFGDTRVAGGLEIAGSLSRGTWTSSSNYKTGADNIVLKGNSVGRSGIFFESEKDGTNINHPSDFGFIQYHAYGTSTSGESNELVIGVSNDTDDHVIVNAPNVNGFKFRTGASETDYTVWHSGNLNPSSYLTSYSETDTLQSVCSRGSNTSTNITSTGNRMTINSTGSCYFTADGGVNQWKYLSLQTNGSTKWDIASKDNDASGALQFRPNGASANRMLLDTSGNLTVEGLLTATQKSFTIDHPTKEGHKLRYGSLEGPENGVYVRGRLKDDNTIELPEYWSELVHEDSITVDVTSIGKQHTWVEDFSSSSVTIGTDGETVNCFYVVYGERKDVDKLVTEFEDVE